MKINIYYGGRGLINDPTLYVMNKMQEVLEELRVTVERFYLQELKNNITTLPQTLKDADGIILASTVEWYGIGGYMQQFLDACWLYGDKEKSENLYVSHCDVYNLRGKRRQIKSCHCMGNFRRTSLQRYMRLHPGHNRAGNQ